MSSLHTPTPQEQPADTLTSARHLTLGIPAATGNYGIRPLLTPEAVAILRDKGVRTLMQAGAGAPIHYTDAQYSAAGASIAQRSECLSADIVLHPTPLSAADARKLRRGALLLTFFHPSHLVRGAIEALLDKHVTSLALDLIGDENAHRPFADILAEIDGRASMALASSLLADAVHGKGILIGGVTGVIPCEVVVIGSGMAARSAARSAIGLGAIVRMFDNNTYSLRDAIVELGPGVAGSSMHPRVLESALRTADVVVATSVQPPLQLSGKQVSNMKRGVITFDIISADAQPSFPTLPRVDLADASAADNNMDGGRVCYINPGNAVPRTAAMALSNIFITMIDRVIDSHGVANSLKFNPSLRQAALTFMGKPVNEDIARIASQRFVDINILVQFS